MLEREYMDDASENAGEAVLLTWLCAVCARTREEVGTGRSTFVLEGEATDVVDDTLEVRCLDANVDLCSLDGVSTGPGPDTERLDPKEARLDERA